MLLVNLILKDYAFGVSFFDDILIRKNQTLDSWDFLLSLFEDFKGSLFNLCWSQNASLDY